MQKKDTLPYRFAPSLPFCPRDFYSSQNNKHSDLGKISVTVMAVATDFHRDFLIPEQIKPICPTTKRKLLSEEL